MRVYFFDVDAPIVRRPWGALLGRCEETFWQSSNQRFVDKRGVEVTAPATIVAHFGSLDVDLVSAAVWAHENRVHVVAVSGSDSDRPISASPEWFYFRREPLGSHETDPLRRQFDDFIKSAPQVPAPWHLLESQRTPETSDAIPFAENFERLWLCPSNMLAGWRGTILSERPAVAESAQPVNYASALTPIDWALTISLECAQASWPLPIIAIIEDAWLRGAFAYQAWRLVGGLLPNVIVTGDSSVAVSHVRLEASLGAVPHDVWEMVQLLWRRELRSPRHRHHVSNALAPRLLASVFPDSDELRDRVGVQQRAGGVDAYVAALDRLAAAVKFREQGAGTLEIAPSPGRQLPSFFFSEDVLQVTSVDDEQRLGIGEIIRAALDLTGARSGMFGLSCESTFDFRRWGEALTSSELVGVPDVLVYDLRLWTNQLDRAKFFANVLQLFRDCRQFQRIMWRPTFLDQAEAAAEQATQSQCDDDIIAALSLPLLITAVDPSYPIVVFSSSGQRVVTSWTRDAPNILVCSPKPTRPDTAREAVRSLVSELAIALELADNRRALMRLRERARAGGSMTELLTGAEALYLRYLLARRYYDFVSAPFEMLEVYKLKEAMGRFDFLRRWRNRKAHGGARCWQGPVDDAAYRDVALFLFMMLTDVLSPPCVPVAEGERYSGRGAIRDAVRQRRPKQMQQIRRDIWDHSWDLLPHRDFLAWTLDRELADQQSSMSPALRSVARRWLEGYLNQG